MAKDGNACTTCHSIGAYREYSGGPFKLGEINLVAGGRYHSLNDGVNSPTASSYDDFMVEKVRQYLKNDCIAGGTDQACETWRRGYASELVGDLETCAESPGTAGCKVSAAAPPDDASGAVKVVRTNPPPPPPPSSMDGRRLMKRYGRMETGWCLSPMGDPVQNGTPVQQVACNETFANNAQNWLHDDATGYFRSSQHQDKCLAVMPAYISADGKRIEPVWFEGARTEYQYQSPLVLWDCGSAAGRSDLLFRWDWIELGPAAVTGTACALSERQRSERLRQSYHRRLCRALHKECQRIILVLDGQDDQGRGGARIAARPVGRAQGGT